MDPDSLTDSIDTEGLLKNLGSIPYYSWRPAFM